MSRTLSILGSTGTIGINALRLVDQYPHYFNVVALSAGKNITLLAEQIQRYRPQLVALADPQAAEQLRRQLGNLSGLKIVHGEVGICEVAAHPQVEVVVSAIVGFAGIKPTLAALDAGKLVALANKESIVAAGPLMKQSQKKSGARLIPVDSEHSAIFQALHGNLEQVALLSRLILTASGGPFRDMPLSQMRAVTPEQALKHPTWNMGAKISIDSATMMNKGLEIIEATRLFDLPVEKIDVVVHPQSIVHSLIEYCDGSQLAQLGITDMRGPLVYAMAYPDRLAKALPPLQLAKVGQLTFMEPDREKFAALKLATHAAQVGKSLPAVLNAANEVAVELFLNRQIGFLEIPRLVASTMDQHHPEELVDLEQVCKIDDWARVTTRALVKEKLWQTL